MYLYVYAIFVTTFVMVRKAFFFLSLNWLNIHCIICNTLHSRVQSTHNTQIAYHHSFTNLWIGFRWVRVVYGNFLHTYDFKRFLENASCINMYSIKLASKLVRFVQLTVYYLINIIKIQKWMFDDPT